MARRTKKIPKDVSGETNRILAKRVSRMEVIGVMMVAILALLVLPYLSIVTEKLVSMCNFVHRKEATSTSTFEPKIVLDQFSDAAEFHQDDSLLDDAAFTRINRDQLEGQSLIKEPFSRIPPGETKSTASQNLEDNKQTSAEPTHHSSHDTYNSHISVKEISHKTHQDFSSLPESTNRQSSPVNPAEVENKISTFQKSSLPQERKKKKPKHQQILMDRIYNSSSKPLNTPTLNPTISPTSVTSADEKNVTVYLKTDESPEETSWKLVSTNGTVIKQRTVGYFTDALTEYIDELTITSGCYKFTIEDSNGDAISPPGYYQVLLEGTILPSSNNGHFGFNDTIIFCHDAALMPSVSPSKTTDRPYCYSNPILSHLINNTIDNRTHHILEMIKGYSSPELLTDFTSAQYKAACWLLHDDPMSLDGVDDRLIQRYLVGTMYFALGMDSSDEVKSEIGDDLLELEECRWYNNKRGYWVGIFCNDDGFVNYIWLESISLEGSIPSELSHLSNLEYLNLSGNKLYGTIPSQGGDMSDLKDVRLSNNAFTGTIPTTIGSMTSLDRLDLDTNVFSGPLPNQLGISSISSLRLSNNRFTGTIPQSFWEKDYDDLLLDGNELTGTVPVGFCDKVTDSLSVDCATVLCMCCESSCYDIVTSSELHKKICDNDELILEIPIGYDFFDTIWSITNIFTEEIVMDNDHAWAYIWSIYNLAEYKSSHTDDTIQIPVCTSRSNCLRMNNLNKSTLLYNGVKFKAPFEEVNYIGFSMIENMYTIKSCEDINLCGVYITMSQTQKRVALTHIEETAVSGSSILEPESVEYEALCWLFNDDSLVNESKQYYFDNELVYQGFIVASLHFSNGAWSEGVWDGMKNEKHNSVCLLEGIQCDSFNMIELLDLTGNQLSGSIPTELYDLNKLKNLRLSGNRFVGSISNKIGYLSSLESLDVSENLLTSFALEDMPTGIQRLNVSWNNLKETIFPPSFITLKNLTHVSFAGNGMRGTIPEGFFQSLNLIEVELHANFLSGAIPDDIGSASNLRKLRLSHNQLEGKCPPGLENLHKLVLLHLNGNDNKLEGNVPVLESAEMIIADCGHVPYSQALLECPSCTVCCNIEGKCQDQVHHKSMITLAFIILVVILVLALEYVTCVRRLSPLEVLPESRNKSWDLCGKDSVYCLLLTGNWWLSFIFFVTVILQVMVFFMFLGETKPGKNSVRVYPLMCLPEDIDCKSEKTITPLGWIIFTLLLIIFLSKDTVNGCKLVYKSAFKESWGSWARSFISGVSILMISMLAVYTSVMFNMAVSITNAEFITNVVILLFINDLDEKFFSVLRSIYPNWDMLLKKNIELIMDDEYNKEDNESTLTVGEIKSFKKWFKEESLLLREAATQETNEVAGEEVCSKDDNMHHISMVDRDITNTNSESGSNQENVDGVVDSGINFEEFSNNSVETV